MALPKTYHINELKDYVSIPVRTDLLCNGCAFNSHTMKDTCNTLACIPRYRTDKLNVIFVKVMR